jgi:hypothetical protein
MRRMTGIFEPMEARAGGSYFQNGNSSTGKGPVAQAFRDLQEARHDADYGTDASGRRQRLSRRSSVPSKPSRIGAIHRRAAAEDFDRRFNTPLTFASMGISPRSRRPRASSA